MPRLTSLAFKESMSYAKDINRRLSSYYPTGDIIWQDDMAIKRWSEVDWINNGTVTLENAAGYYLFQNPAAISVDTAAVADSGELAMKRLPFPPNLRLGLEGKMRLGAVANGKQIQIEIETDDGVGNDPFYIIWRKSDGKFMVDALGGWVDSGIAIAWKDGGIIHFKLVVDGTEHKYVKLCVNGHVADLKAYSPRAAGATVLPEVVYLNLCGLNDSTANTFAFQFGDIIVTMNEP